MDRQHDSNGSLLAVAVMAVMALTIWFWWMGVKQDHPSEEKAVLVYHETEVSRHV